MNCLDIDYFHKDCILPPKLTFDHLAETLTDTARAITAVNKAPRAFGMKDVYDTVQKNCFSGLVSNYFSTALAKFSPYKENAHNAYPDNIGPTGLEIKTSGDPGKGGESHNAHTGWHAIISYEIVSGALLWTCIKFANLFGFEHAESDWKYCGSKRNANGSQRTETYNTTPRGRAKLLEGICYLDTTRVTGWKRWRVPADYVMQPWSLLLQKRFAPSI